MNTMNPVHPEGVVALKGVVLQYLKLLPFCLFWCENQLYFLSAQQSDTTVYCIHAVPPPPYNYPWPAVHHYTQYKVDLSF